MTTEDAQKLVGLSALALILLGPLSMILPLFVYTPLDAASWWQSLGAGLLLGLAPVAGVAWLWQRGLLETPQGVVGGALVWVGTAALLWAGCLLLNGGFDRSAAVESRAIVESPWRECSRHKPQNSTTEVTTCRNFGRLRFIDGEERPVAKFELPEAWLPGEETPALADGPESAAEAISVTYRRGAFGWRWGLQAAP